MTITRLDIQRDAEQRFRDFLADAGQDIGNDSILYAGDSDKRINSAGIVAYGHKKKCWYRAYLSDSGHINASYGNYRENGNQALGVFHSWENNPSVNPYRS